MDFYEKNKDLCVFSAVALAVALAVWVIFLLSTKESDNDRHIKQLQSDFESMIERQSAVGRV